MLLIHYKDNALIHN